MSFLGPVRIQDVLPYVPHRPPMVWVDKILLAEATHGECVIHMKRESLFWCPEGLRKSSCLEFIAQSYGYGSVAYDHRVDPSAKPLTKTFLASFKDVWFADAARFASIQSGDDVVVRYSGVRKKGAIIIFEGEALHQGDSLCRAQLKVFCES